MFPTQIEAGPGMVRQHPGEIRKISVSIIYEKQRQRGRETERNRHRQTDRHAVILLVAVLYLRKY